MKRLQIVILLFFLLFSAVTIMAQERTITGTVMDGEFKGEPLIGANVVVGEGTSKGTTTDMNGHFLLTKPVKSVIMDSYCLSLIFPESHNNSSQYFVSVASLSEMLNLLIKSALLWAFILSAIFAPMLVPLR